ncbi:hypothetical protein [Streptomyces sp. CC228A]|uniref:hypothetical protein n=1 Tax=Streptomyces sp. CC228A TaxID=2898186 RepID=UPI001F1E3C3A|nr:hypothetical protein [Streptomyces sp. CC228A]
MGDNVPVRCPVCRRTHPYTPTHYPCACGAPVTPPLMRGAPAEPITHRTWNDEWVTVRCAACGQQTQWPQPELGCPCGTVLRIPVRPVTAATAPPRARSAPAPESTTASATGTSPVRAAAPPPQPAAERPPFHPVTIRTARDVVTAAALYLRWLGFRDVAQPEERRPSLPAPAVELRAPGLMAQVDPTTRPVALRAVECLWLEGLAAASTAVCFSLAGYEAQARARAESVGLPLFVMDLAGAPQPVNTPGRELVALGA